MNFKKNFKRFFTMSRSAEGFTLVELIVVIAILGILVGVGMPAYGSYVEAANLGVDRNNLAIVNNCFAVACIENGVDPATGVSSAVLTWSGKSVTGLESVGLNTRTATDASQGIITSFAANLGAGVEFKVHTSSDITFSNGKFVSSKLGAEGGNGGSGNSGAANTGIFGNIFDGMKNNEAFQQNVTNVKDSQFGAIGAAGLMNKVDTVTGIATDLANLGNVNEDGTITYPHQAILTQYAGQMYADLGLTTDEAIGAMLSEKVAAMKEAGATGSDADLMRQAQNEMLANYAVLAAAKNTSNKTTEQLQAMLTTNYTSSDLKALVKGDADSMAQAALIYGMYTAYANGLPETTPEEKAAKESALANLTNTDSFGGVFSDPNFTSYLSQTTVAGSQASKDLAGYQAAMDLISDSAYSGENGAANSEAIDQLVSNGFTDPQLQNALQGLLG